MSFLRTPTLWRVVCTNTHEHPFSRENKGRRPLTNTQKWRLSTLTPRIFLVSPTNTHRNWYSTFCIRKCLCGSACNRNLCEPPGLQGAENDSRIGMNKLNGWKLGSISIVYSANKNNKRSEKTRVHREKRMKQSTMKKGAWKDQRERTPDLIERETRTERGKKSQWIIHGVENHRSITHIKRRTRINLWPHGRRERKKQEECGVRVGIHLRR